MFSLVGPSARALRDLRPALEQTSEARLASITSKFIGLGDLLEERKFQLDHLAPGGGRALASTLDPLTARIKRLVEKAKVNDTADFAFELPLIEKDISNAKEWIHLVCEEVIRHSSVQAGPATGSAITSPASPVPARNELAVDTSHTARLVEAAQAGHSSPVISTPSFESVGNSLSALLSPAPTPAPTPTPPTPSPKSRPISLRTPTFVAGSARSSETASNLPLRSNAKTGRIRDTPPLPSLISSLWTAPAPWPATHKQTLLVVLSVGATSSGASVTVLHPDTTPLVRLVTAWPSGVDTDTSTTPTEILYDRQGTPQAHGSRVSQATWSQARQDGTLIHAYHNPGMTKNSSKSVLYIIPGLTLQGFFIDFVEYLLEETRQWWLDEATSVTSWQEAKIVVTSGDGWKAREVNELKKAAGVISAERKRRNVFPSDLVFVEDGVAKCHFYLAQHTNDPHTPFPIGHRIAVLDATDSLVTLRPYSVELVVPQLKLLPNLNLYDETDMGDASILRSMETLLTVKLRHSKYGKPEYIQSMMEEFRSSIDQYTDLSPFPFMIKFGLPKHDDPVVGIQKGRLTLSNAELRSVFGPTAEVLTKAIIRSDTQGSNLNFVALSGIAQESPYLRQKCVSECTSSGIEVLRANEPVKVAARRGAALWHISEKTSVTTFYDIGLAISTPCTDLLDDKDRVHLRELHSSGKSFAPGGYAIIAPKGATLHDRSYFSKKCWIHAPEAQPAKFSASVIAFRSTSGDDDGPEPWSTDSTGCLLPGYYDCGIVQADFTTLVSGPGAAPMLGGGEKPYRQIHFKVVICLDEALQGLSAYVSWTALGKEFQGPRSPLRLKQSRSPSLEVFS